MNDKTVSNLTKMPKEIAKFFAALFIVLCVLFGVFFIIYCITTPAIYTPSNKGATKQVIGVVKSAIEVFKDKTGQYPAPTGSKWAYSNALLIALKNNEESVGVLIQIDENYFLNGQIYDGYGNPIIYKCQDGKNGSFKLVSAGEDGKFGKEYDMGDNGDPSDNIHSDELD